MIGSGELKISFHKLLSQEGFFEKKNEKKNEKKLAKDFRDFGWR
jgi:hypothetical protein